MTQKSEKGLSGSVCDYLEAYFISHHGTLPSSGLYQTILDEVERPLLEITLRSVQGNQSKAADILGINRNTLRKKILQHGIDSSK